MRLLESHHQGQLSYEVMTGVQHNFRSLFCGERPTELLDLFTAPLGPSQMKRMDVSAQNLLEQSKLILQWLRRCDDHQFHQLCFINIALPSYCRDCILCSLPGTEVALLLIGKSSYNKVACVRRYMHSAVTTFDLSHIHPVLYMVYLTYSEP